MHQQWVKQFGRIFSRVGRREWLIYTVVCGVYILLAARLFYSSLKLQTLYAKLWSQPALFDHLAQAGQWGEWSAPLDDVFIHFDFARATARGYPFQWIEGNGYSSGGTSLLYPFVLAFGYWLFRFHGQDLMVWAGVVACVSVLATLLASRRLFQGLPRWTCLLAPIFLLGTGVLNWTLFSGMEVALFLGIWGVSLVCWDELWRCPSRDGVVSRGLALGAAALLLVATRPEAALTVAIFSLSASAVVLKQHGRRAAFVALACSAVPGALLVLGQAVVNRWLTGDFTAAGALAKLEMHHPYLTQAQVREKWWFHLTYQIRRVTEYHLSVVPWLGWLLWVFAALGIYFRTTRRYALLLWACATAWVFVVALNGQVRWQNERYTMPALAWLLLAAALGFAAALTHQYRVRTRRILAQSLSVVGVMALAYYQAPRFRDQVWFFGRASRNILEQHVTAGRWLRHQVKPERILLSDAGAIPYAADLPAVDLIGLGGYQRYPFARATRFGSPGGLELIERLPERERPDVMALYPSWWPIIPLWFGERLGEIPVRGNVICGGVSKVIYKTDWSAMRQSPKPLVHSADRRVVDSLDFGDIVSEKLHHFTLEAEAQGHLTMKLLADPREPTRDLWDAGRIFIPPLAGRFQLQGAAAQQPATLWFRVAPAQPAHFDVELDGQLVGKVDLVRSDAWVEVPLKLPADRVSQSFEVRLIARDGGFAVFHLWLTQSQ